MSVVNKMNFTDFPCTHCGSKEHTSKGYKKVFKSYDRLCKSCGRRFVIKSDKLSEIPESDNSTEVKTEIKEDGNTADIFIQTDMIQDIETLLENAKIDREKWIVKNPAIKTWAVPYRNSDKEMIHKQMFSLSAKMEKRIPDVQIAPVVHPVQFHVQKIAKLVHVNKNNIKRSIIFGDMQMGFHRDIRTGQLNPFHDRAAIDNLLQILESEQPDEIITIGDNLDMTEAGKYEKKPEFYFTTQPAINELGWVMSVIRETCPNSKIVYHNSNHAIRLQKSVVENLMFAYQLRAYNSDHDLFSFENLLGLNNLDIEYIPEYPGGEYWINKNLRTLHGNYINLKKELDASRTSFIMGHIHKLLMQTQTIFDRDGRSAIMGASIGCLCKIDGTVPAFTKNVNWQQGIGSVESDDTNFNFQNISINNGKSIFRGEVFQGHDYEDSIKDLIYLKK